MIKLINSGQKDNQSRPIYKDTTGNYYVDVDLGKNPNPSIHTVTDEGEPLYPVKNFEIIDSFDENDSFMRMRAGANGKIFESKLDSQINNIKKLFK